ncbi:hypothetical protein [Micromonospora sp. NPDC049662]|uniref:hypothetical protein n=1 Tax=Micromonospora sp. NPDC049662 TaxID=3155397 RepID=UPI00342D4453
MRINVKGLVLMMIGACLAACAEGAATVGEAPTDKQSQPSAAVTGAPTVHSGWTSCTVDAPIGSDGRPPNAFTLPRLGTDFAVASAVHCQLGPKRRADGGEDLVLTEGRATDLAALLAALRLPDDTTTIEVCTADMPWEPNLLLFDAQGQWIRPGLPMDTCGRPLAEVTEAVRALRLTSVSDTVVRELVSAGAAAAGCSQDWSTMVTAEARSGRVVIPSAAPLRLCVFRVPAQQQSIPQPAGTFEYGILLPQQRRATIERTLATLRPAKKCSGTADRFAVLQDAAAIGGDALYVELDHCRRVLAAPVYGAPILAQADSTLIELLKR